MPQLTGPHHHTYPRSLHEKASKPKRSTNLSDVHGPEERHLRTMWAPAAPPPRQRHRWWPAVQVSEALPQKQHQEPPSRGRARNKGR